MQNGELPHILVVDDDRKLRDLLVRYLGSRGIRVSVSRDVVEARAALRALIFDLIILDIMMPGEQGMEFAHSLRQSMNVPILMLTAVSHSGQRIAALEGGVDDYLTKPFEPRELVARIRAILKRVGAGQGDSSTAVFGDFSYDVDQGRLFHDKCPVPLTSSENAMLAKLARLAGTVVSREELLPCCGLDAHVRSVDTAIARLRKKIEANPKRPIYLQTVRSRGYVLSLQRASPPDPPGGASQPNTPPDQQPDTLGDTPPDTPPVSSES